MKLSAAPAIVFAVVGFGVMTMSAPQVFAATKTTPVVAPTPSPSPVPTEDPASSLSMAEFSSQLQQLKTTYRQQLTNYRTSEKQFLVAKEQYSQIQTLASLEEAVKQTRQVMLDRVDVLSTYFSMMKLALENTKGLEPSVKKSQIGQLSSFIDGLKLHRAQVASAADRQGVYAMAVAFVPIGKQATTLSERIGLQIGYGNLQTVTDKLIVVGSEIRKQINDTETDPLKLAEKNRGLDETGRNVVQVRDTLTEVRIQINPSSTQSQFLNTTSIQQDFATIFGGLSRAVTYLQELLKT